MAIKCTYGDVGNLRRVPGSGGPLAKLMSSELNPLVSVVDRWRLVRFVKALGAEVDEYTRAFVEVAKRYGTPKTIAGGNVSYEVPPERQAEFVAEKKKLDESACEVQVAPLPISVYEHAGLTASDLMLLEKFLVVPDET
jgi:hypothetical protein